MKYILISALLLIVACGTKKKEETQNAKPAAVVQQEAVVTKINTASLKDILRDADGGMQLVDVRTLKEVQAGHIEGAITGMDFLSGQFEENIDTLDKNKPVILYCRSGNRSNKAALILEANGFKKVYDYTDGYSGWSADQ